MPCPIDPAVAPACGPRPVAPPPHPAGPGPRARRPAGGAAAGPGAAGWRAWAGAGLLLALAGCSLLPPAPTPAPVAPPAPAPAPAPPAPPPVAPPPPAAPAPAQDALQRLLGFHERSRSLPAAELAREQARLAGLAAGGSDEATLKLAWLLGQARAPGDVARAIALLEPQARGDAAEAPLARLLLARLAEQRRLEEQLERQAQQQRELQRRNDQLREQLDALRAIERSLGPRPAAPATR